MICFKGNKCYRVLEEWKRRWKRKPFPSLARTIHTYSCVCTHTFWYMGGRVGGFCRGVGVVRFRGWAGAVWCQYAAAHSPFSPLVISAFYGRVYSYGSKATYELKFMHSHRMKPCHMPYIGIHILYYIWYIWGPEIIFLPRKKMKGDDCVCGFCWKLDETWVTFGKTKWV